MRLLPRTLFGRLVLILVSGLVIAQTLTVAIQLNERQKFATRALESRWAARVADTLQLLDSLSPAERDRVAAVMSSRRLKISTGNQARGQNGTDERATAHARALRAMLLRALAQPQSIRIAVWERATRHGTGAGRLAHLLAAPHDIIVDALLRDGTSLRLEYAFGPPPRDWPFQMLVTLLVLLTVTILVALLAVRLVIRPLQTLTAAAEALGADINRPPLPETGPSEVRRAAQAFNTMQDRLVRFIDDRTRMLAAISHDLRTPITRMLLRTESLNDAAMREKFQHDLSEMESMVDAALNYMRGIDAREHSQRVDLMALIDTVQADAEETGKHVVVRQRQEAIVACRPMALKRALHNLVDNAVKYGGNAEILVEADIANIIIRINDNGPGIPPTERNRVFEPFYRLDPSRNRDQGGTGLGLSIARNIVRAHGGELTLCDRPGGGLQVVVTLPRETRSAHAAGGSV